LNSEGSVEVRRCHGAEARVLNPCLTKNRPGAALFIRLFGRGSRTQAGLSPSCHIGTGDVIERDSEEDFVGEKILCLGQLHREEGDRGCGLG
jgi:hypothetical protein